jgi:hypothetical protein
VARAIVDSGADNTTLPADWADQLDIDLETECVKLRPTVAVAIPRNVDDDEHVHYVYPDGLWVEILGERLLLPTVSFCKGLTQSLLGRRDFFPHYLVAFDQRNLRFFLERLHDPEEDDDPDELGAALALH